MLLKVLKPLQAPHPLFWNTRAKACVKYSQDLCPTSWKSTQSWSFFFSWRSRNLSLVSLVCQMWNDCALLRSFVDFCGQSESSSDVLCAYRAEVCLEFFSLSAACQPCFTETALRDYWNGAYPGRGLYWKIFAAYGWPWGICVRNKNIPYIVQTITTKQRSVALWFAPSSRREPTALPAGYWTACQNLLVFPKHLEKSLCVSSSVEMLS